MSNNLHNSLASIARVFNINEIISEKKNSSKIKKYYLINHFAYLIFHNRKGFMHMGLSKSGKYRTQDLHGQVEIIQGYLRKKSVKNVLEIGSGNGSNSVFLAKRNPNISFIGIDLSKKPKKIVTNYVQKPGNFHRLNMIRNDTYDVSFVIEALCHSRNKRLVLGEVYKKLKKGGLLIIFDGYYAKPRKKLLEDERLAILLTEKTMAVDRFENLQDFEKIIKSSRFNVVEKKDLSKKILPTLRKFEKLAKIYYKFPIVPKALNKILPSEITKNSIAGLLMPYLVDRKIAKYYLHVLKKP